jgi:hypothetical protein
MLKMFPLALDCHQGYLLWASQCVEGPILMESLLDGCDLDLQGFKKRLWLQTMN